MEKKWEKDRQLNVELKKARAEGAGEALPESLIKSHELIRTLQRQIAESTAQVYAREPKWTRPLWFFVFGVIASIAVTVVLPRLVGIAQ